MSTTVEVCIWIMAITNTLALVCNVITWRLQRQINALDDEAQR